MIDLLRFFLFLLSTAQCTATEIRWIPGDDPSDKDPAKTAPKSQKYWDEHNIPKPDYAKTDLEFAEDQGLPPIRWLPHPVITMLMVGLALGLASGLYVKLFVIDKSPAVSSSGKRLGSAAASAVDEQASVAQLLSRLVHGESAACVLSCLVFRERSCCGWYPVFFQRSIQTIALVGPVLMRWRMLREQKQSRSKTRNGFSRLTD